MLAGSIGKVGSTFSIDLRTIDVTTGRITNSITRDYRGQIDGLLVEMSILAGEIVDFEAPETASRQTSQLAVSAEQGSKKRSSLLKWAVIGAAVAGGGYLGITLLAGEEADSPTIDTPPSLPEGP